MRSDVEKHRNVLVFISVTALGISSVMTQLTMIRELLSAFVGNELVVGIIIGNWLFLTGVGSYLGKFLTPLKKDIPILMVSQLLIAVLPLLNVYLIRTLRNTLFIRGQMLGIIEVWYSSLILLLPYCVISGYLLIIACNIFTARDRKLSVGEVYFMDNIGDILGGALFSFILIYFLNSFQILYAAALVNLIAAIAVSIHTRKRFFTIAAGIILAAIITMAFGFNINLITREIQYSRQSIAAQEDSIYGNVVVTRDRDQYNFFENGQPLFSTDNIISREEAVHYAMLEHPDPKTVLLVSGGASGTALEALKYPVDRIDYVELDPVIIRLARRFTKNLDHKKINTITTDARLFVKHTRNRYDVIIIDLPDPAMAQVNRFYTVEFFREVKRKLTDSGVFSISLTSAENYLSPELERMRSVLHRTLGVEFKNVIIVPGDKDFFIASDGELDYEFVKEVRRRGIETEYVNRYYLPAKLTEERINYSQASLDENVPINRDFSPVSSYYFLRLWLSYFNVRLWIPVIVLSLLLLIYILKLKPVSLAIFTTGFAGAGLELVLIICFQIIYGYVYHMIGVLITVFMLGLSTGSFISNRYAKTPGKNLLVILEFTVAAIAIVVIAVMLIISRIESLFVVTGAAYVVFPLLNLSVAFVMGFEFPVASRISFTTVSDTAGKLYSADLIGSSVGAVAMAAFLIPLLGVTTVCIIIAAINILSGLRMLKLSR